MLSSWTTPLPQQTQEPLIKSLAEDCMRLALHIISWAGFGIKLKWPKRVSETSYDESLSPDETLGLGHTMSFQSSLHYLLEYCYVILASPNWYLKYTPVKMHRVADKAYYEWDLYMREMIEEKQKEIEIGTARGDIMGALVRANDGGRGSKGEPVLCEQDVIGNTFVSCTWDGTGFIYADDFYDRLLFWQAMRRQQILRSTH